MTKKKGLLWSAAVVLVLLSVLAVLLYTGVIGINHPSPERFPVKGVDVSSYQGEIDWERLAGQGIRFAYIKATEGSSMKDPYFDRNWSEGAKTDLRIGAYHFFSFETGGKTQAENLIGVVTAVEDMLPIAVDVEPYGGYTSPDDFDPSELSVFLRMVEDAYGVAPVVYTTRSFYDRIADAFPTYDIWIRSVYGTPPERMSWTFWQYSNRTKLDGYLGEERFIDLNVFAGTPEEFEKYGAAKTE